MENIQKHTVGKMSAELSTQMEEKTSELSLKNYARYRTVKPMYLDLRTDGERQMNLFGEEPDSFWGTHIQWHGEHLMQNFGECPKCVEESTLSDVLQAKVPVKYCLSPRACQGILQRSAKRGKEIPQPLKEALEKQSGGVCN